MSQNQPNDYLRLYSFASNWVKTQFKPFTSEEIKKAFYETKNEPIQNVNVFGLVMKHLHKEEAIYYSDSVTKAKLPLARGRLIRIWISREYKLKQKTNRLAVYKEQQKLF